MIIYNEKEMESEYCVSDDMLLIINSTLPLSEIFDKLQKEEDLDPETVQIRAYMNNEGKVVLESDKTDKSNQLSRVLSDETINDLEEQMVQEKGYGQRNDLFKAFEQFNWGNKYEGYDIKAFPFTLNKNKNNEIIRRHIALSSGIMPTIYNEKDKSLKELVALSNLGNDLYRNFGKGSVTNENPLPSIEDIEFYSRFTEYEKQLMRKGNVPPRMLLTLKHELEDKVCKGSVITEDMYNDLRNGKKVEDIISSRISNVALSYVDKFKAEFKKQYGFDRSPIIPEFITGIITVKGDSDLTDKEIEEAVKSFNRNSMQAAVHDIKEPGKDKETKITVAQTRNPALIYLATQFPMQDMPKQMIRALATYVNPSNIKSLVEKGFPEWIKEHKNDSVADVVKLLSIVNKVDSFDKDKNAFSLYNKTVNKRADKDRIEYEKKYGYKFSDNEIAIRGRNIVIEQGAYRIRMLKADDLVNFSVAYTENTHCCQHLSGAGESCVWKYTTDPFAACVVVEDKSGQIQAQGFVWTDEAKDLFVFDNIEYHHDPSAGKLTNIIEAYIEALPYQNVQIGMGYVEAADQAWNGIGSPIDSKKDLCATIPTTIAKGHIYSDYHTEGGSKARVVKKVDGRTHQAKLVKYTVNTNGLKITDPGDEPTKWDILASKEFAFMLNDCSKSIDERLRLAEEFRNNPTKELQLQVLDSCPEAVLSLDNIDTEVQLRMYDKSTDLAKRIKRPCKELQIRFSEKDPSYLKTIENPDPEVITGALEKNGLLISVISNPTYDNYLTAVKSNGYAYRFIPEDHLTEEIKMEAVKQAPKVASLLKNPSPEIQLEACRALPDVVLLLNNPTIQAQMAAVSRKPELVLSLKNPAEPVVRVSVQRNPYMIRKFQFQYPDLKMDAIRANGFIIRELKNITMEEYNMAVQQNPEVARLITPPETILHGAIDSRGSEPGDEDGIEL